MRTGPAESTLPSGPQGYFRSRCHHFRSGCQRRTFRPVGRFRGISRECVRAQCAWVRASCGATRHNANWAMRCPNMAMGAASLHKSMGAASLHKSMGTASLHKSMSAASLHRSVGAASLHKSMGTASLHKSMSAASLHKSMSAASLHKSMSVASLHKSVGAASLHKSMSGVSQQVRGCNVPRQVRASLQWALCPCTSQYVLQPSHASVGAVWTLDVNSSNSATPGSRRQRVKPHIGASDIRDSGTCCFPLKSTGSGCSLLFLRNVPRAFLSNLGRGLHT